MIYYVSYEHCIFLFYSYIFNSKLLVFSLIYEISSFGLPFVYLGYWVPGSPKMGYKARFKGLEVYSRGHWQPLGDPAAYSNEKHPMSVDPIAEQVANITLPDTRPTDG